MSSPDPIVIVSAVRTPMGAFQGELKGFAAPELGADSARNLSYFLQQWWIPVMPGLGVLVLAVVGNIAGDSLRNLMKTK